MITPDYIETVKQTHAKELQGFLDNLADYDLPVPLSDLSPDSIVWDADCNKYLVEIIRNYGGVEYYLRRIPNHPAHETTPVATITKVSDYTWQTIEKTEIVLFDNYADASNYRAIAAHLSVMQHCSSLYDNPYQSLP